MDERCKYLTKIKYENGTESWTCYHEFENRGLIQSCFLPKGGCRYNTGPFCPTAAELEKAAADKESRS